ncbi:MAG: FAD-dependent oxidoreductase [Candidatus Eremiobacteraeota bacterium]|nr:FAD-dependent oxidoreductase [Candidatus Eremiobacteraeota bacterium]
MKIGILGGGVSGVALATRLKEKGIPFVLLEKESTLGGLMRTRVVKGFTFDIHGGHIFNSKHAEVKSFLMGRFASGELVHTVRQAKILYRGKVVSYPFELAMGELEPADAASCIMSLMSRKGPEPRNFRDWLIWRFGREIARRYLIPYNKKIWRYPLGEMEVFWVKQDKIPIPDVRKIIIAALSGDASERMMPHSTFFYPRHGGAQAFVAALAKNLEKGDVLLNTPVKTLEAQGGGWLINGSIQCDKVISAIPLTELPAAMPSLPGKVANAIADLKYNSVTTFLFEMPPTEGISWLYVPDPALPYHRISYPRNFSPHTVPKGKESGIVEYTGKESPAKIAAVENSIGAPPVDRSFTELAYVIYDMRYRQKMAIINRHFDSLGIPRVGRFATWQYLNFDVCIRDAFSCLARELPGAFAPGA